MKVMIVSKDKAMALKIEEMLRQTFPSHIDTLEHKFEIDEAIDCILNHPINLLIIDFHQNDAKVHQTLKLAQNNDFQTIILSEDKSLAIEAYNHGVLDFVLKPLIEKRLKQALERYSHLHSDYHTKEKYLALKKRQNIQFVGLSDVLYFKGAGMYAEVHLGNGEKELHSKSLESLEKILRGLFVRIHRSFLVRMSFIKKMTFESGNVYKAELKNGELLPVGRTKYKLLKEQWI